MTYISNPKFFYLKVTGWGRTFRKQNLNTNRNLLSNKVNVKHLQVTRIPITSSQCIDALGTKGSKNLFKFDKKTQICAGGERGNNIF